MSETAKAEINTRGVITIPKKLRDGFQWEAGQELEFVALGDAALLLVPKRLALAEARQKIRAILKQSGVDAKEVLAGLDEARQEVFDRHYKASRRKK